MCKKLFCILLLALLLPPAFGDSLTETQTLKLRALLTRYEQNEMRLSDELIVLNWNLERLLRESENSKKLTSGLKKSLTDSRLQAEALVLGLENMGKSITTLETSLRNMERKNKILEYCLLVASAGLVASLLVD